MPLTALALVVVAAVLHAGWNALTKRATDPLSFLWSCMGLSCVVLVPAALLLGVEQAVAAEALPIVVASMVVHAIYFFTLTTAYRHGELSLVYPTARGLGVALVPVAALPLFDERPSSLGIVGISLVVLGIVATGLVAHRPSRAGSSRGETKAVAEPPRRLRGMLWAVVTGVLIATYSLVDRAGVQRVHPIVFVAFMVFGAELLLLPVVLRRRALLLRQWRSHFRAILIGSTMTVGGYAMVLFAFQMAKTGYVVATRELSIVLSALIGGRLLQEGRTWSRLAAASVILAGVGCIAMAR